MTALASDSPLLQPITVGSLVANNRLFMAPLTRSRATDDGVPTDLQVEHYRQRASAGLIIAEGTQPSAGGKGYTNTPGLHTDAQQAGWARVADAVHEQGGTIVVQVMHAGRMSHPDNSGHESVAPSAIAPPGQTFTKSGMQDTPTPRALETDELPGIVADFVAACTRAVDAGLDGVELHAANGYLLHEFLSNGENLRTDSYGGSPENRARLVVEVARAVAEAIGADKVGIRISPGHAANGITETDNWDTYAELLAQLEPLDLAYLHVLIESDDPVLSKIRDAWSGVLVLNTGFAVLSERDEMERLLADGAADAVSVGRPFIANPDLVERWALGAPLNELQQETLYGGGAEGYTDYPPLARR
ncbi:alkene reductase [Rhodococcus sp. X156]|uniref:alkene reductase n=1 Tax=Rhodococcus sp. X156 TaxID=2499145 RepID=UPI000FD960EE|nr:alkene reductase [Rhodococcus sp. X156]